MRFVRKIYEGFPPKGTINQIDANATHNLLPIDVGPWSEQQHHIPALARYFQKSFAGETGRA